MPIHDRRRVDAIARRNPSPGVARGDDGSTGTNKGKLIANVGDERRRKLERLGRERAVIYKKQLLTGLRKAELAALSVTSVELDGPMPYAVVNAAAEKSRHGS